MLSLVCRIPAPDRIEKCIVIIIPPELSQSPVRPLLGSLSNTYVYVLVSSLVASTVIVI